MIEQDELKKTGRKYNDFSSEVIIKQHDTTFKYDYTTDVPVIETKSFKYNDVCIYILIFVMMLWYYYDVLVKTYDDIYVYFYGLHRLEP